MFRGHEKVSQEKEMQKGEKNGLKGNLYLTDGIKYL